jgi:SAM-dependent methyltransferase
VDVDYVAAHCENDRRHWWFRGRLAVLLAVLRRTLPRRPLRVLELGCGSGNVLDALREFGEVVGMETHPALAAAARAAGLDVRAGTLPGDEVVPRAWADVVLLLDVIEHVDDDAAALQAARVALAPAGHLVVTVPAYPWLWSRHDVRLGHRRRYTARTLRRAVESAGFRVERVTYFNTLLFPAVVAARLAKRAAGGEGHDLVLPPAPVNRALAGIFAFERHVVSRMSLPLGTSLLLLARP